MRVLLSMLMISCVGCVSEPGKEDRSVASDIMASATPALTTVASMSPLVTPSAATLSSTVTNYTGLGFDSCAAPSSAAMNA